MNGLEDLVRATLAERAHDVDRVQLHAPVARPVRSRRWVAIGTVVAVAAAIIVAVVLVAPWNSTGRRAAPAAFPMPPAGMQWVSYRGITLTVPESWRVSYAECIPRDGDVVDLGGVATTSCPYAGRAPQTTTVSLGPITDDTPRGEATTIAGHPALRTESIADSSPQQVMAIAQLTQVGIALTVSTSSPQQVDEILGGIEYTPVDHYGCTAQPSGYPSRPVTPGIPQFPTDVVGVVVCEYSEADTAGVTSLLGSRPLEDDDVTSLKALVANSEQGYGTFQEVLGTGLGEHVYLVKRADGTVWRLTADPQSGTVVLTDGAQGAVVPGSSHGDLPGAYP